MRGCSCMSLREIPFSVILGIDMKHTWPCENTAVQMQTEGNNRKPCKKRCNKEEQKEWDSHTNSQYVDLAFGENALGNAKAYEPSSIHKNRN